MKNTLMFLMASLLLAFNLTACGGGSQTNGAADSYGAGGSYDAAGQTGTAGTYDSAGQAGTNGTYGTAGTGSGVTGNNGAAANNGVSGDGLMDDARDAMDDAGRAVRNTMDNAARNF